MKAKITLYREHFVVEILLEALNKDVDEEIKVGNSLPPRIFVINPEANLGISKEAAEKLAAMPHTENFMTDFATFDHKDKEVFGFIGSLFSIKKVDDCKVPTDFYLPKHIAVPNEPNPKAIEVIDDMIDRPEIFEHIEMGGVTGTIRKSDLTAHVMGDLTGNPPTLH